MRAEYDFSKGKRGAVIPQRGKTRISIFIDNTVLAEFRARAERAGTGYQTMMNEALHKFLSETERPVTEKVLRQVLRQSGNGREDSLSSRSITGFDETPRLSRQAQVKQRSWRSSSLLQPFRFQDIF